jgi:hypothetical protein
MKTLQLEDNEAKRIYKIADVNLKIILERSFGEEFFSEKIMDRIKTWSDVLFELGLKEQEVLPYPNPETKEQRSINAFAKIQKISQVLNEGWVADFSNKDQSKYYPYFEKTSSGWRVDVTYGYFHFSRVGAGCFYKTRELALYAASQFLEVYKDYLPD